MRSYRALAVLLLALVGSAAAARTLKAADQSESLLGVPLPGAVPGCVAVRLGAGAWRGSLAQPTARSDPCNSAARERTAAHSLWPGTHFCSCPAPHLQLPAGSLRCPS